MLKFKILLVSIASFCMVNMGCGANLLGQFTSAPKVTVMEPGFTYLNNTGGQQEIQVEWYVTTEHSEVPFTVYSNEQRLSAAFNGDNLQGKTFSGKKLTTMIQAPMLEVGDNVVRFCATNPDTEEENCESKTFNRNDGAPSIEILSVVGVDTDAHNFMSLHGFTQTIIRWQSTDRDIRSYSIRINGGCKSGKLSSGINSKGGFVEANTVVSSQILVTDLISGAENRIYICAEDGNTGKPAENANWTITRDDLKPILDIQPTSVATGNPIPVNFNCSNNCKAVACTMSVGASTFPADPLDPVLNIDGEIVSDQSCGDGIDSWQMNPDADLNQVGATQAYYKIKFRPVDEAGNLGDITTVSYSFLFNDTLPQPSIDSLDRQYISTASGNDTATLTWRYANPNNASQHGYEILIGGDDCDPNSGSVEVRASGANSYAQEPPGGGGVPHNTPIASVVTADDLQIGPNKVRLCVRLGQTAFLERTIYRVESPPIAVANPAGGNYGMIPQVVGTSIQNSVQTCGTTVCAIAFTTDGSDPQFDGNTGAITNGLPFTGVWSPPDTASTTLKLRAIDQAGNIGAVTTETYNVDTNIFQVTVLNVSTEHLSSAGNTSTQVHWQVNRLDLPYFVGVGSSCDSMTQLSSGANLSGTVTANDIVSTISLDSNISNGANSIHFCVLNIANAYTSAAATLSRDDSSLTVTSSPVAGVVSGVNALQAIDLTFSKPMQSPINILNYSLSGAGLGSVSLSGVQDLGGNSYRVTTSGFAAGGIVDLNLPTFTSLSGETLNASVLSYNVIPTFSLITSTSHGLGGTIRRNFGTDSGAVYKLGPSYVGGCAPQHWRYEKISKSKGQLDDTFGSDGVVLSNPTSCGSDHPEGLLVDEGSIYGFGRQGGYGAEQWRIEKRDAATGDYDTAFGTDGVLNIDMTSSAHFDYPYDAVADDGGALYLLGVRAGFPNVTVIRQHVKSTGQTLNIRELHFTGGRYSLEQDSTHLYIAGHEAPTNNNRAWQLLKVRKFNLSVDNLKTWNQQDYNGLYDVRVDDNYVYAFGARYDASYNQKWWLQRLNKSNLSLAGIDIQFNSGTAVAIDIDSNFIYLAGQHNGRCRVEKRYLSNGNLVVAFDYPTTHECVSLKADGSYLYVNTSINPHPRKWQIDKRKTFDLQL